jgi:hypothetical protein
MTTYAKRKLKYSRIKNLNLLHYVEWDQEIYLLYVSNTYHMNFECVGTFVFVGVSMFIIVIK